MAQPRRQRRTRDKAQVGPPSRLLDFTALGLPELSAKPRRRPAPVSPDAFVGIANPAPLQAEPADLPTPLSQRLVRVTGAAPKRLTLTPSRDYEGLFELPSGLAVQEGIPGRTGTVERMKPSRAKRSPGRKTARVVEGYAPPWATLGINPAAVFEPPPLDRKLPDGRRIRLHQDITVYGDDNRVNIYPNTYPERCVCRITVFVKRVPDGPWIQTGRATGFIAGRRV